MQFKEIITRHKIVLFLFIGVITLLSSVIFFTICLVITNNLIYQNYITVFTGIAYLFSALIALSIPFITKEVDGIEEKDKEKAELKNMLIVLRNLIMYCINYWNLKKIFSNDEKKLNLILQKLKKGLSIIAHLESLKMHKDILHKINTILRENSDPNIKSPLTNEKYEIFINDEFLILIDSKYVVGDETSFTFEHDINLYDLIRNKKNLNIDIKDLNNLFDKINYSCKTQFDYDIKLKRGVYLNICETCVHLQKVEEMNFFCLKTNKNVEKLNNICENYLKS